MDGPNIIDLSGRWRLRSVDGEFDAEMALPGDIISGLEGNGLIVDPYFGKNEYDLRWIADRDWTLSRAFEAGETSAVLVIDQLDTIAEVSINGKLVLSAGNAFRRWRKRVDDLNIGANEIEITLKSPTECANILQAAQPYYVPYTQNYPVPNGNMLRKPQCDFGWDWNAALMPSGVYGAIRLDPVQDLRIADILIHQDHLENEVELRFEILVECEIAGAYDWSVEFEGVKVQGNTVFASGEGVLHASLKVQDPQRWWPAGQGAQVLNDARVSIGAQTETRRIGLRTMELVSEEDDIGRSLLMRVNGRDVFCKGANWIPADALAGKITPEATRDLLQSAVDANMNMIRIWGGGWYEPDWFYDICDELGLMVWQDAMFSCSLYPATESFLAEVSHEIEDVARRLQHRTCIALWCGDNELIGALTWYPESLKDRDRYLVAYDRLNRTIETGLKSVDAAVNWWPSSPSPGPLSFGDAWHDDSAGDMHFWSVWHEGRDFEHYRDVTPRFCSEFGFQSYPSLDVIRKFANPEDMNIASPVMESHQKNVGGNARIAETMFRYFRFPVGFENFVYLSQVQQAEAIKTAVTHWRTSKPHCMGALIWQLNDTWPVASWASLDHGGGWKILHHAAKDFFAPLLVTAVPVAQGIEIRAVNDLPTATDFALTLRALRVDGVIRDLGLHACNIDPSAAMNVTVLAHEALADDEILLMDWSSDYGHSGADSYAPRPFKNYDLVAPDIEMDIAPSDGAYTISLSCKAPAFFVSLEADQAGRLSDNGFHLLPGESRTITFTPRGDEGQPSFVLRDLFSATYE